MSAPAALLAVDTELKLFALEGDDQAIGTALAGWSESGLTCRVVRGHKMRNLQGLFDEFAAALQFPLYFGENTDAFDECISDLEGLGPGSGFVVTIVEPAELLADVDAGGFEWLVRSLGSATETWGLPVQDGEWWDRPALPFHVVLAGSRDSLTSAEQRWARAGAAPVPLS